MENFVEVYAVQGQINAEMVKNFLVSKGINAFISQESAGVTYGLTVGPLGLAKIYVPEEQEIEAVLILEKMDRGEFDLGEDTPEEVVPPEDDPITD